MQNLNKRVESEILVQAYRAWAAHIQATKPGAGRIIFMDDLSDVRVREETPSIDWLEAFQRAIQLQDVFTPEEIVKVKQSLEYVRYMDATPSRETVEACGGIFEEGNAVLSDIEDLTVQIEDMEKLGLADFPSVVENSVQYARAIAKQGFEYLNAHSCDFHPLDFSIRQLDPSSPFVAQVITEQPGEIFCEIPFDRPVTSAFAGLMIHEILGHVFHFSQLKKSVVAAENPHLVCLSLHTHEGFFIEAISQLITAFMSIRSSWEFSGKEQIGLYDLKYQRTQAIAHYLITKIIDGDLTMNDAVKFHSAYANGTMTAEFLESRYKILTQNIFTMKSTLNYYPSFKAVKPLLALSEPDFFKVLKELVNGYYTPDQLKQFVQELRI